MKTTCLIIDDEPLSVNIVKEYILKLRNIHILGIVNNAIDALNYLEKEKVDLIFLDINMPEISGYELLKSLQNPPKTIIISAFKDYALEGYELNIIDFLFKPFSFERFLKAMNKFRSIHSIAQNGNQAILKHEDAGVIHIKENKKIHNIQLTDLLFIESMRDYVKIHINSRTIILKSTMNKIEEILPSDDFVRIHKSYIISIDKVTAYCSANIEIDGRKIPIGKFYKNEVLKVLDKQGIMI